jgi:histidinol dehydrogenase/sulfopropanediol 3-dehydrogenase
LITTDRNIALSTLEQIEAQLKTLPTANVAGVAWKDAGEIVVCPDEATMIQYSDYIAPEHLQVHTRDAQATARKLRNYGSLFIGPRASVVYSDKCCGTNHTLPTMRAGRYTGGLWVGSYVKVCTHQWMDSAGVEAVAPPAIRQSATEGMEGHRRAAAIRLERPELLQM